MDRGPQISPANQFKIENVEPLVKDSQVISEPKRVMQPEKKVTSVRVRKSTRDKLNALVSINKADTIDDLLVIMIDEYLSTNVLKDEKKHFDIALDLYKLKG